LRREELFGVIVELVVKKWVVVIERKLFVDNKNWISSGFFVIIFHLIWGLKIGEI
jgi:hypothetical protein